MNTQIISTATNPANAILLPTNAGKDVKYRVGGFIKWQADTGGQWFSPDLSAYRDYLLNERNLASATVKAHLSTIRGRYNKLMTQNSIRDDLMSYAPNDSSIADRKAFVDEILTRLQNATHASNSTVKITTVQDVSDNKHLRLKPDEIESLINQPTTDTLKGLRDTAIIALMACTGIREAELCNVKVSDLRHTLGGELSLFVSNGKGDKQRLIPYGALEWCLRFVDAWIAHAGITSGYVFRGFYKGYAKLRAGKINTSSVWRMLCEYPISHGGQVVTVKPHDIRRSYARNLYEAGLDMERIRQNLGHADIKTTQVYIGVLDANQRRPPAVYHVSTRQVDSLLNA